MSSSTPELETRVLAEGRFLRLAAQGRWEYAERINCSGAVAIVAVTPEDELILVEQVRVPVGTAVVELPAGLVGDDAGGESDNLTAATRRELEEEAGFTAEHVEHLATGPTTPGLTNEQISLVHATGVRRVGEGGGVDGEEIHVHLVPLGQVRAFLREKEAGGALVDLKLYAGLCLAGLGDRLG